MKNILDHSHIEAKKYFLKEESYFNFDLPQYFTFKKVIQNVSKKLEGKSLSDFYKSSKYPYNCEDVNYKLLNNKDGKFSWRPFQLIHPAIYVSLVNQITEHENWEVITKRFKEFGRNKKIQCFSLPFNSESELSDKSVSVSNWWQLIEQKSIELALEYEYIIHTDISDCYGSFYTHSVAWALHTKIIAKKEKNNKNLIGNIIDKHLQNMSFGQTNGIPQGSTLMDFIAEIILGFVDLELSEKIEGLDDFQVIRYRDDYRIFSNSPQVSELILKHLTEILIGLGLRLNAQKTLVSRNIIQDSIKPDKMFWICGKQENKGLQEDLLLIFDLSQKFPNSGTLIKALDNYFIKIKGIKKTNRNVLALISILADIMYKNPRAYPIATAILSKLLKLIESKDQQDSVLSLIKSRFDKIPNTGYLQLWLQRLTLKHTRQQNFEEKLCRSLYDENVEIWNSSWLSDSLKKTIDDTPIINKKVIENIPEIIADKEVRLFYKKTNY